MHNNSFLIQKLAQELDLELRSAILVECFSQNKDEMLLIFQKNDRQVFYIQAHLTSDFSILNFPENFRRAKSNTVSLFEEINGKEIKQIGFVENERAFIIYLEHNFQLLFKLYGNRSNLILCRDKKPVKIFKKNLSLDWNLELEGLERKMDISLDNFLQQGGKLSSTFFTMGKWVEQYLMESGWDGESIEDKYRRVMKLYEQFKQPRFFLCKINQKMYLLLFPMGEVISEYSTAKEALSNFYVVHFKFNFLEETRQKLLVYYNKKLTYLENQLEQLHAKLKAQTNTRPLSEIADLIMANLHQIPSNAESIELFDFYNQQPIKISLPFQQSPQDFASRLYKKSKNRFLSIAAIENQIETFNKQVEVLQETIFQITKAVHFKELSTFIKASEKDNATVLYESNNSFKTYEYMGFKIWVGRNAKNNDELTQKHAHKDDLWLHAKDVGGSHVIVKQQSGKPFPKPVIEYAASLAAYYSKRKTESLCPVSYTLKKYVRKVKGAPAGAVKLEREQVIMVQPLSGE